MTTNEYRVLIAISDPPLTQAERRGLFWALSDAFNGWLVANEMDETVTGSVKEIEGPEQ